MRILIPDVDSVNSLPAVRYVIREFLSGERFEVHLLHVRNALHRAAAGRALQPARALLENVHVPYAVHLKAGDKARTILTVARRVRADRIVLGTARRWSATRLSEDSVIQEVLDAAPMPVTLVAGKSVSRVERYGVAVGLGAALGLILSS
jgi:nucleotide-binding universal stress UspA family protein